MRPLCLGLLAAAALAGCGSEPSSSDSGQPAPTASAFPKADGRALEQILAEAPLTEDVVVSPASSVFRPGQNRFSFGVFTVERDQIDDAEVAIYAARGPDGRATGPFPARIDELTTAPAFEARSTSADADAATSIYTTRLSFTAPGEWRLIAVLHDDEGVVATRLPSVDVRKYAAIPRPGDPAPRVDTPTIDDVGNIAAIDTRVPPDAMHDVNLADALGRRPVVLLFATPALCQSRVCGPVVDIAEQVKSEHEDEDVAFIHMEVFRENDAAEGYRPQLAAYGLETEPWLFVIDDDGKVSSAIEGGFSVRELEAELTRVLRNGASG